VNHFHVGQEVACIDDTTFPEQWLGIQKDKIYKIRWIGMYKSYLAGEYLGVLLDGVTRPCPQFGDKDVPFRASRFRPLVKDPIAVFRGLLASGPDLAKIKKKEAV